MLSEDQHHWIISHLTVWGLLCEAAMWRTVQPLLSRMGEAEPPSVRFTMDSALDKQSRAMSEITSYYYLKLWRTSLCVVYNNKCQIKR